MLKKFEEKKRCNNVKNKIKKVKLNNLTLEDELENVERIIASCNNKDSFLKMKIIKEMVKDKNKKKRKLANLKNYKQL